jgi:hypothetical protein
LPFKLTFCDAKKRKLSLLRKKIEVFLAVFSVVKFAFLLSRKRKMFQKKYFKMKKKSMKESKNHFSLDGVFFPFFFTWLFLEQPGPSSSWSII